MLFIREPDPNYYAKVKKNYHWAIELLEEKFDGVLGTFNVDKTFIYGVSICSALSGTDYFKVINLVTVPQHFEKVIEDIGSLSTWEYFDLSLIDKDKKAASLRNTNNQTMRIITPLKESNDIMSNIPVDKIIWDFVKSSGLRCFGLLMGLNGDLFEVIPGALEDVFNKRIYVNSSKEKNIKKQIKILEENGWVIN